MNFLAAPLAKGIAALGIHLPADAPAKILAYLQLLDKWNQKHNLTAVRNPHEMLTRHVLDCLAVVPYLHGLRILDVGTGAGLPGLMLAIARPDLDFVLLDSHARKIRFVTQAAIELELDQVEAISIRVEHYQPDILFDSVISRAYTSLEGFYQQTRRLASAEGKLLAMKGSVPEKELSPLRKLGVNPMVYPLQVPELDAERHLIVL